MISLLLLNNFYPVIGRRTSSKEEESDELLYTVRSLVMVRARSQRRFSETKVKVVARDMENLPTTKNGPI